MVSPVCPTRYTVDIPMCTRDFDGELGHGSLSRVLMRTLLVGLSRNDCVGVARIVTPHLGH